MDPAATIKGASHKTAQAGRQATTSPLVENLARAGYIARGLIYTLIGLLAVELAVRGTGKATDQTGALSYIGAQPSGKAFLLALVIGLLGYALWGFVRALFDPLKRGTEPKGLLERAGFLMSGISYGALALVALFFATGWGTSSAGKPQDLSAQLMGKPFGVYLVALIGLFWIGAALSQFVVAWKASFMQDFKKGGVSANERVWAERLGRFGYAARGIIFFLIGWFLLQSALSFDPKKAVGFDGALLKIAQQPFGQFLLAGVALGIVAFGLFSILCARWMEVLPSVGASSSKSS